MGLIDGIGKKLFFRIEGLTGNDGPLRLYLGFFILLFVPFFFFQGCARKAMGTELPLEPPARFSISGDQSAPEKWWTAFGDEQLNRLIDTAMESNFSLRATYQRLLASRAVVDHASASRLPFVDASAQGAVSRTQTEFEESQRFRLELGASYEVDLWGRIGATIDAERYRAEASLSDFQTAALSLSAEISLAWFRYQEAQSQLQIVDEQIRTNEEILRLVRNRFGTGQVRSVDILRQEQLLEATREQRTYIESELGLLEHQLATLIGRPPQDGIDSVGQEIPDLPPLPETGVPVELVQRRPDVQAIYHHVLAADRDLAAAISNQYPRLSLSASLSTSAGNVRNLFEGWAASLAGNLLAPVFYGGQRKAEVRRNEAVKQELLFIYGQTVLIAFREVEDALIREQKQKESIASIEMQLEIARQTHQQLRLEYFNGLSNYLDVLTSLDSEQQLERDLLSARLTLLEYRLALYRALAGGIVE